MWGGQAAREPSRPARGAWVEIKGSGKSLYMSRSRPARGAWVEIPFVDGNFYAATVAPRKGRVG